MLLIWLKDSSIVNLFKGIPVDDGFRDITKF